MNPKRRDHTRRGTCAFAAGACVRDCRQLQIQVQVFRAAFLVVVLAAAAVGTVLLVRDQADTRTLSALASGARERVDPAAGPRAEHRRATRRIQSPERARRGQQRCGAQAPAFIDDATVAAITCRPARESGFSTGGAALARPWRAQRRGHRSGAHLRRAHPGAATPETLASLTVVLEQARPCPR